MSTCSFSLHQQQSRLISVSEKCPTAFFFKILLWLLFPLVPSLQELCMDRAVCLYIEAFPFTDVKSWLYPIQPPTEVGQICWEYGEVCVLDVWRKSALCLPIAFTYAARVWCWDNHVWVMMVVWDWALGSVSWAYLLGVFMMSQRVCRLVPGLLMIATAGCAPRAAVWHSGTSGMQSRVTLTLPRREAARDMGCPLVNTQIAARSLWEDEGCWILMCWEFW